MNRLKRIKLTRAHKTIRNAVIVIALLAVLPMLFDMHFERDAAAQEILEKAGCEDAEFTGYYDERPCLVKYEEYSYSTADDKDSYNRAMKASGTPDIESEVYYRYTDGGREYIIAVSYKKYMGFLYKAGKDYDIKECGNISYENISVKYDKNTGDITAELENINLAEFAGTNKAEAVIRTDESGDEILNLSVYRTDFGGLLATNAGADIVINMTSGSLEKLSFTDGFRWSRYSGRYRLQKDRSETLSGEVRRSAETSMDLTPKRAEEICRAVYNQIKRECSDEA